MESEVSAERKVESSSSSLKEDIVTSLRKTIFEELRKETSALLKAETENIRLRLAAAFEKEIMGLLKGVPPGAAFGLDSKGGECKKNLPTLDKSRPRKHKSKRAATSRNATLYRTGSLQIRKKKNDAVRGFGRAKTALPSKVSVGNDTFGPDRTILPRIVSKVRETSEELSQLAVDQEGISSGGIDIDEGTLDSTTLDLLSRSRHLLKSKEVARAFTAKAAGSDRTVAITTVSSSNQKRDRKKKRKKKKKTADFNSVVLEMTGVGERSEDGEARPTDASPSSHTRTVKTDEDKAAAGHTDTATLYSTTKIKPPPARKPTTALHKEEWENEVARNILSLYRAQILNTSANDSDGDATSPTTRGKLTRSKKNGDGRHLREKSQQPRRRGKVGVVWGGPIATRFLRKQIWFSGSGALHTVWCALANERNENRFEEDIAGGEKSALNRVTCEHELCSNVRSLEAKRRYEKYVALIKTLLLAHLHHMRKTSLMSSTVQSALVQRLWRQLVASGCVFATNLVKDGAHGRALAMLEHMRELADSEDPVLRSCRRDLLPFVYDTYAFYYYRRRKTEAGMDYLDRAMRFHVAGKRWTHVAQCRLHRAALLGQLGKHAAAVECLGHVIADVENGKLEDPSCSRGESLCLVAVCYHNIATLEIYLENFQQACIASQNARRLARLCLTYSNRWLKHFDATHRNALIAMVSAKEMRDAFSSDTQKGYFGALAKGLYT